MDYSRDLHILSSFSYGSHNFSSGKRDIQQFESAKTVLRGFGKIALGALEMLPVVGLIPTMLEKKVRTWSYKDKIAVRESVVLKKIHSDFNQVRQAYLDQSASQLSPEAQKILGSSSVDMELFALSDNLQSYKKTIKDSEPLTHIIKQLEDSKELALISTLMARKSQDQKKLKQRYEALFAAKVKALKPGEAFIAPAGCRNLTSGHAILLHVSRNKKGNLSLRVYNTGEGVSSHHQKKKGTENHFYPLIFDNIPESKLLAPEFAKALTGFLSINVDNQISSVYRALEKQLGHPRKITRRDRAYLAQGLNNCTKKCLQAWLHEELRSEQALYNGFRAFRTERHLKAMDAMKEKAKTRSAKMKQVSRKAADVLFAEAPRLKKGDLQTLYNETETLAAHRKKKLP